LPDWRIYRLPGSREIWHVDSGCGTQVFNVKGYCCAADTESVDISGNHVPRAWIAVNNSELHIVNGKALFVEQRVADSIQEVANVIRDEKAKCAV